jgi:hypothetical protein
MLDYHRTKGEFGASFSMIRVLAATCCLLALGACTSWIPSFDRGGSSMGGGAVELRLDSEPPGAEARTSAGPVCRTPCAVQVAARGDLSVTFTLAGFRPATVQVGVVQPTGRFDPELPPEGPRLVPNPVIVELEPAPPPPRRKPAKRRAAPGAAAAPPIR